MGVLEGTANNTTVLIGTGGIGSGVVYSLEGDHSLGREETRLGHRLDSRDFCKLHIISHYLSVLLRDAGVDAAIFPIGAVGDDNEGAELCRSLSESGLPLRYIHVLDSAPTLHSVCFQFPDGSGGNITESRSASVYVDESYFPSPEDIYEEFGCNRHIVVFAVPEVPLPTRLKLLDRQWDCHTTRAASFLTTDIVDAYHEGALRNLDILALNMDEARALAVESTERSGNPMDICAELVLSENPEIDLYITNGSEGAFHMCSEGTLFLNAPKRVVRNSAGAGDAFLAGLLFGRVLGLPRNDGTRATAFELAMSLASLSVESLDTINFEISYASLKRSIQSDFNKLP